MEPESRTDLVDPLKGLAPWLGGKRHLGRMLSAAIGRIPHRCYAEPFVGMGGVFFRRRRRAPVEAINDIQNEVVNLFRVVQRHPAAIAETLSLRLGARAEFMHARWQDFWRLTDVERAARFYYIMQCGFHGRVTNPGFASGPQHASGWDVARLGRRLRAAHRRLAGVAIENLGYADFIDLYDNDETLFYLDPPYYGHEGDYGRELFARSDFERLARRLARIRGRFIFSINDAPAIREMFRWAQIEAVAVTYTIAIKRVTELVIASPGLGPIAVPEQLGLHLVERHAPNGPLPVVDSPARSAPVTHWLLQQGRLPL